MPWGLRAERCRKGIMKLDPKDRHLLSLIRKDKKPNGWTSVSKMVWPLMLKLPRELVELEEVGEGGIAKLTETGETVLDWT